MTTLLTNSSFCTMGDQLDQLKCQESIRASYWNVCPVYMVRTSHVSTQHDTISELFHVLYIYIYLYISYIYIYLCIYIYIYVYIYIYTCVYIYIYNYI